MTLQIKSIAEYEAAYKRSVDQPEAFWAEQAETFVWRKKWNTVLDWNFTTPDVKWFVNGKLNITENCLDRHLATQPDKLAIIWEPNNPNDPNKTFTYRELHAEVCRFANVLKKHGIGKGDRVCFYLPMIPQMAIATLACARIGAIHSIVFAGFSANALADRINDASCKMVLCADGNFRGEKTVPIKDVVDEALENCPCVEKVIVFKRTQQDINWQDNRDLNWEDELSKVDDQCEPEIMDSEDTLFVLYTSGSTGKPKGVQHSCGGYMVYTTYSFKNVFQPKENDIYWCTADVGWITGHSYIIYGPLAAGATTVMFEGIPSYPDCGRFWQICEKYKVNIFYTAPTAIRALMAQGLDYVKPYDLSALRVLGTVGEPINAEAWHWYSKHIGKDHTPIVDTWWQTETGGIMISSLAGITEDIPTYATLPLPGIQPCLVNENGKEIIEMEAEGYLCVKFPWPSILRSTYGDHERCRKVYFDKFKGKYFTGDGAKRDANGNYRIIGRVDDVIIVSGHNLGTAEIENGINQHPNVVESAVVGFTHPIKGNAIYAFAITDKVGIEEEIVKTVSSFVSPIAKPAKIQLVKALPKTRSGKIMRRILRKIANGDGENLGDISTLLNPEAVQAIKDGAL